MKVSRRGMLAATGASLAGCVGAPRGETKTCADETSRIGFVGDVMLGRSVNDRWVDRSPVGVWGSMRPRLDALDGLVLNLECCISDRGQRWPDKVFYFRANPDFAVPALEAVDASAAALANNHMLDFQETGLLDTLTHLDEADVAHAGAGPSRDAAFEPAIFETCDLTVAVLSLTEQWEAFAATDSTPGTAHLDLDPLNDETRTTVKNLLARTIDAEPDIVVASLHWGPNWETEPDTTQRAFAQWLVEQGVDVVHGHSAHVLQGVEVHEGRPIIYDAGDFVDDYIHKEGLHNKRSGLFELVVDDGDLQEVHVLPTVIESERANRATGEAAAWVEETIRDRSAPFGTTVTEAEEGVKIPL